MLQGSARTVVSTLKPRKSMAPSGLDGPASQRSTGKNADLSGPRVPRTSLGLGDTMNGNLQGQQSLSKTRPRSSLAPGEATTVNLQSQSSMERTKRHTPPDSSLPSVDSINTTMKRSSKRSSVFTSGGAQQR